MPKRDEKYLIQDGVLVQSVVPRRGRPYEHTCSLDVFTQVAYTIERLGAVAFTGEDVRVEAGRDEEADGPPPWTQAAVAMAFLKERGCIIPARQRRHIAVSGYILEDALCEWHALREKGPVDPAFGYTA